MLQTTPTRAIPRSTGDVVISPPKRRKTNESLPTPTQTFYNTNKNNVTPDSFSVPSVSPDLSFSSHISPPLSSTPPLNAHGGIQSFDFVSLLDPARRPNRSREDEAGDDTFVISAVPNHRGSAPGVVDVSSSATLQLLSPRLWNQKSVWPRASVQEACLMRYFVQNLAHWVRSSTVVSPPLQAQAIVILHDVHHPSMRVSAKPVPMALTTSMVADPVPASLIFVIQSGISLSSYHSVLVAVRPF